MNFTKQGDWTLSTPVYVGSAADVAAAQKCPHDVFVDAAREVREGTLVVMERCSKCVATRVKYRPLKAGEKV